ncbi:MAG: hypothetical protein M1825_000531 [Sarcosagium campestre]|nr:MAG: hypothetical protein M1825_000531 [Sarcosagium campestre]
MSSTKTEKLSAFVEGAPPGEMFWLVERPAPDDDSPADVCYPDIKALTVNDTSAISSLGPAFERYSEEQLASVTLPGGSNQVLVSSHNSLGDGRYFDVESQSSFLFDHVTQKASAVQTHTFESKHSDLIKSLLKSLATHIREHYLGATYGVYPAENDTSIAILVVANKYSPSNFWNGRWRSLYIFSPSTSSLKGNLKVDVHYYEDGNVRLLTDKPVTASFSSSTPSGAEIVRQIASLEKKYQEELNRAFNIMNEGAFKSLRRQLPITRQKIEWEKISSYRAAQDIGGSRGR